ncbi:MAG TPA: hemolysin family protein [Paracoccaceae bacterium]|nr:hemolysin family protein [Paracoccaceae bacterium]
MLVEIAVILGLTLLNGVLAMSELSVVSSRPARLKLLAEGGSNGARVALRLAETPGRFLSTVQIGITLVGVLSGAFSGATLGVRLAVWLEGLGMGDDLADGLGVGLVVVLITYLSLVVGELVPKQIALRDPEVVAARVAPAMALLSRLAAPLGWLLERSSHVLLLLLGQRDAGAERMTEEEMRSVIAEAESAGVIEAEEKDMITGVMRLADRAARALMTPRREVELIDLTAGADQTRGLVLATRRTRLPVREGGDDAIIGVVEVKDVILGLVDGGTEDVKALVRTHLREAPVVMDGANALHVLSAIRGSRVHMALVFDEYGHFEGVITSGDVLEAITGVFLDEEDQEPACVQREDGSWLVAGWTPLDEFSDRLGIPVNRDADYVTVAGLALDEFGRLPAIGESFVKGGWRFEVLDLDGRRIDKLLVSRLETSAT